MAAKSATVTRPIRESTDPAHLATVRDELIRRDAYGIFCTRTVDGRSGDEVTDWLQAERDLSESDQPDWQR